MSPRPPVSQHVLPTASNLLGLCFVILSFIHVQKLTETTLIDDVLLASISLFFVAAVLSYSSIRSSNDSQGLEKAADITFMTGLGSLAVISLMLVVQFIR